MGAVDHLSSGRAIVLGILLISASCKDHGDSPTRADANIASTRTMASTGTTTTTNAREEIVKVAVSAGAQPIVVGEIWVSDETGAAVPRDRRPMEKAELERIVFEAFRAQGGRQKTAASGRLQVRVAVATRKKHESFVAVSGVLSLDDDRFEANAIGFRPVPKGEGADRTYREIVERAVRDTVESLALKVRVPKLPVDQLVALLKSRPDGGAEGERRLIAANELAERRDPAHFDLFVALLKDDEPAVARRAVGALVSLKDARAVNPLIDFAARKDPQTLREVIYALGDLGGAKAEAFLWTLEKGHEHPAIRQAAHDAIDLLKKKR